jgi:hypothetical protein
MPASCSRCDVMNEKLAKSAATQSRQPPGSPIGSHRLTRDCAHRRLKRARLIVPRDALRHSANRSAKLLINSERMIKSRGLSSQFASGDFGACTRYLRGRARMEHRTFVPTLGILAGALTSAWISSQASAEYPSHIEDERSANIEIVPNESAEARVTVVPKTVSSKRAGGFGPGSLGAGFGLTPAPIEPPPLFGEYIPRLIAMALPSPLATARPATTVVVPRAVTPKAKPKPAAQEPQQRQSWLRLLWWRR